MSKLEQSQLQAGGFVRLKAKVDQSVTEEVVARRYGSAALGDRVVVRLSADRLGPAEDLAMEYLGLEPSGTSEPVARQTKRALGFANWALTHHPEHARFALSLVKRLKAAARRAKSKPGHAWDELTAMADELNKSVRHFLPAFWEEAARIYKDLGNQTYAGRSLNKALEAERVHALEVDREHRREAVLEFTLSGCLSGKALGEYAKDLESQFEPAEAYDTLRDLVVRRTLGGMAPTATMGKDLMRLAKAAGLDADGAVESVLQEIISSPAMSRAPLQFWKSVKKQVGRLVQQDQMFAVWLLVHTDPQTRYGGDSPVWNWLELLEQWNVLPQLWADALPQEPELPGGRAGWIGRLARLEESPHKLLFDLIENMAEVLRRESAPVPLFTRNRWRWEEVDVDVLEALLDLGIDVGEVPPEPPLAFGGWLRAELDHPRRNSQLTNIAADPRFAPALRAKIPELIPFTGESSRGHYSYSRQLAPRRAFEAAAADHPAVSTAWWAYLDEQLTRLEQGALADAEIAIAALRHAVGPKTAEQFPELPRRLEAVELVDNLHRTLTAGVLDEYGWPALEEAAAKHELPAIRRQGQENCTWVFPHVAYYRDSAISVVHPDQVALHRELTLTAQQTLALLLPVLNDVAVAYRDRSREWSTFLFWISARDHEVKYDEGLYGFAATAVVPWGDGAFFGARVIKPGDRKLAQPRLFLHDGQRFWGLQVANYSYYNDDTESSKLVEIDPETGKEQRASVPAWFEEVPTGATVTWAHSRLLPLPAGLSHSPLGSQDGLIGWKLVSRRDGTSTGQGIDGRSITLGDFADRPQIRIATPRAMMDQPAGDAYWVFTEEGLVIDSQTGNAIADFRGRRTTYGSGQPTQIPIDFLHCMQVRHLPSSQQLRQLTRAQTQQLLRAAAIEHEALRKTETEGTPEREAASAAVRKLLPDAPAPLVLGLARIARIAAEEEASLTKLRTFDPGAMQPKGEDQPGTATVSRISEGLSQLDIPTPGSTYYYGRSDANIEPHLREVVAFLLGASDGPVIDCSQAWLNLWQDLAATAWRCFWRLGTVEGQFSSVADRVRQPWLETLTFLADSGVLDLPGKFRLYLCDQPPGDASSSTIVARRQGRNTKVWVQDQSRYVAQLLSAYPKNLVHVLEYSADGTLRPPQHHHVNEAQDVVYRWTSDQLRAFIAAVRELRQLPLATVEQLEAAAAELQLTPIEVALVWMGNLRTVSYGADRLTKELRTHYQWKVKPVQEAIASLEANVPPEGVVGAPLRADSAGVFRAGQPQAFADLVAFWKQHRSSTLRLAPELITVLEKGGGMRRNVQELTSLLSDGAKADMLRPRKFSFSQSSSSHRYRPIELHFEPPKGESDDEILSRLPLILRIINYALPAGDPVRRAIPAVVRAVREFLADKNTVLPFGLAWASKDYEKFDGAAILAQFTQALGKPAKKKGVTVFDDKFIMGAVEPPFVQLMFRTAGLTDEESLQRLVAVSSLTFGWEGTGENAIDRAHLVQELRGEELTRLAAINQDNPVADGRWEQDPRCSAAQSVAAVQKKLKLDEEAAALYLQLLALPDPTSANVRSWNDWSTKQLKQATEQLLEAELVVQAKRARAGRDLFLAGGWEALKAPNLPIESWKLPLYGVDPNQVDQVRYTLVVPRGPVSDLFAAAWQRIVDGDVPRYEESV